MITLPLFPFFSLLLAFLLFMFMILKLTGKTNQTRLPGPWKLPIIGNLHNFAVVGDYSLPHRAMRNLAKKYGPFMQLKLGEISLVVVTSVETTKEVLRNHDVVFSQRSLASSEANMYASRGLIFSPYGDYWRQLRRVCTQEMLSPKRVKSFQSIREEEVSNLIEDVDSHKGSLVNLTEKIFSLTYSITARAAFGNKCNEQQVFVELVKEGSKIAAGFNICDLFPSQDWLRWISGTEEKLEKNIRKIDQILETIIGNHNKDNGEETLLDVLFNAQKNNDDLSLDTSNIKAVILDMFVAGGETSSTVVEWAMAEMIKNPKVMQKAQVEVRQVFGGRENVEEENLNQLEFLDFIIKETLRLHPPVVLVPRESRESCVINGYQMAEKTKLVVNTWAMGRDPRYWTDPEKFCPERFHESCTDFKGNDFEFIPFGAGRRMCPGIFFALADIKLPLAQLLFHFDWKLADGIAHESLDMNESFGLSVRRKMDLYLIPIPYVR